MHVGECYSLLEFVTHIIIFDLKVESYNPRSNSTIQSTSDSHRPYVGSWCWEEADEVNLQTVIQSLKEVDYLKTDVTS